MDLKLANKTVIVTGGTGGLGLATAATLVEEGANVLVAGRSAERFAAVRARIGGRADQVAFVAGDNASADMPARLRDAALERWGRIDGLLVSVGGPPPTRALETGDDLWRASFESVFLGAVRLVRDLSPAMADGGAIALVLAISAREAAPTIPISSGLRPGLAMLAKNFAEELGPRQVRINALLPNLFATERVKEIVAGKEPPVGNIALRRIGAPEEFARVAAFLLSPAASYVTGAAVSVDGGQLKSL